jgi:Holliday junction DNA helicase RuvA
MLGYLRGQILENGIRSGDGKIILGVGSESMGFVGYSVNVPRHPNYELLPENKSVELFIYTHVREDSLDLYGFATRTEKELFLTLLTVNGIGPKGALSILCGAEPSHLIQAIIDGDKELLTKIPGIGKKTAERVVLELTDPLKKKMEAGVFSDLKLAIGPSRTKANAGGSAKDLGSHSQTIRDAVSALVGLGYRENEIAPVVSRTMSEATAPLRAEDLIKTVLRQFS